MRNFYLFEKALQVTTIIELEQGLNNLNKVIINRDAKKDSFLCNPNIWECEIKQGKIYDLFGGIVNTELQRVVPSIFRSFRPQETIFENHVQMDDHFPDDCNALTGFEFSNTIIQTDRQVFNRTSYDTFVNRCLKDGKIKDENEMKENLTKLFPNLVFTDRAVLEILNWKNSNSDLYNRLFDLFEDIPLNPFKGGIGETEVLKYVNGIASKRINQAHRVTYKLKGNITTVLACSGHYN